MRRLLVDQYRRKQAIKRGGGNEQVPLSEIVVDRPHDDMVALDEGLDQLAETDPQAAKVVELRYFPGLGHEQICESLGITIYQARQKWTYARAWLRDRLDG